MLKSIYSIKHAVRPQSKSLADTHLPDSLRILADPFSADLASWLIPLSFPHPPSCCFLLLMSCSTCIPPQSTSALGHLSHLLRVHPPRWYGQAPTLNWMNSLHTGTWPRILMNNWLSVLQRKWHETFLGCLGVNALPGCTVSRQRCVP